MKVGDGYIANANYNRIYTYGKSVLIKRIINDKIGETIYYQELDSNQCFYWLKEEFLKNYTFDQKTTDEQLIKDIVE